MAIWGLEVKQVLLLFLFLVCSAALFSYEGMLAGQRGLKVIKTEYLDIIYTPGSEKSAAIIAEHGDDIYRELQEYGITAVVGFVLARHFFKKLIPGEEKNVQKNLGKAERLSKWEKFVGKLKNKKEKNR